jgi:hypothetical protein
MNVAFCGFAGCGDLILVLICCELSELTRSLWRQLLSRGDSGLESHQHWPHERFEQEFQLPPAELVERCLI